MKVAVFIDNSNVFKSISRIKKSGDASWPSLYDPLFLSQKLAGNNRELVSVNFYCTLPPISMLQEGENMAKKHNISKKYYSVIEKMPLVEVKYGELVGPRKELKEKNLDTQLTADIIVGAALGKYDTVIIVSNDGDYVSAVEAVKQFGIKIEVVFFKDGLSMALRRACDLTRRVRKSHFRLLDLK